jgi:hypothetical protein
MSLLASGVTITFLAFALPVLLGLAGSASVPEATFVFAVERLFGFSVAMPASPASRPTVWLVAGNGPLLPAMPEPSICFSCPLISLLL